MLFLFCFVLGVSHIYGDNSAITTQQPANLEVPPTTEEPITAHQSGVTDNVRNPGDPSGGDKEAVTEPQEGTFIATRKETEVDEARTETGLTGGAQGDVDDSVEPRTGFEVAATETIEATEGNFQEPQGNGTTRTTASRQGDDCPDAFFSLGSSCYRFFAGPKDNDTKTWQEAQSHCSSLVEGGKLVELETQEEIKELTQYLIQETGGSYEKCLKHWAQNGLVRDIWIGGIESQTQPNSFIWASDKSKITDANWKPALPSSEGAGDAIVMYCLSEFQWFDVNSEAYSAFFICEVDPAE